MKRSLFGRKNLKIIFGCLALLLSKNASAEIELHDWGGVVSRSQNDERSFAFYLPHLWEKGPRLGLFSGDKISSNDHIHGITINQFLSTNKLESMVFFVDLRLGEEKYKNLENDSKKFKTSELGFFTGVNIAWPSWKHSIVASIGVVDRTNYISDSTITENHLQLQERSIGPAWQIWFVF